MKETINELWAMTRQAIACIFAFISAVFGVLTHIFTFIGMMFDKIGQLPHYVSVMAMRVANTVACSPVPRVVISKFARHTKN